jgi:hypothetical protein
MRRYPVRVRPDSKLASVVVGWDSDVGHYVCEQSYLDGRTVQKTFGYLRDLIFRMHSVAALDDVLLRGLLRDRARSDGGGGR